MAISKVIERYKKHLKWLGGHDVSDIELREFAPEILERLLKGVKIIDGLVEEENLPMLEKAIKLFEKLYLEGEKIVMEREMNGENQG